MNRTLMVAGVLAVIALALLIVACGSDPEPTAAPATAAPPTATPVAPAAAPTVAPTTEPTEPAPPATPTRPAPTPTAVPTSPAPTAAPTQPAPTQAPPMAADPSDAYFAMDRVLEVSIEIAEEDWDTLRHQTRTFDDLMAEIEKYNLSRPFADIYDWFSATVTIDGEAHTEVGVRKKGFLGSQSDTKPSLKLRYDKYVDGQSLGGVMERMTLNNSKQDPSMVNTCLSYQVFAAAGMPSPRCNFATVTVNGKELGLYIHLEELKPPFLARHFDSAEGNHYEGNISDFIPSHRGTFEKKTNEDEDDWSDIDAVVAALQDPSDAGLEALAEIVDLDRYLSFWATEALVGHWDGYAGNRNNYHFYREPGGKFVFIPWGVDDTFHLKPDPNPFDEISNPPPSVLALSSIPNRLYNHPEWRLKYAARLKEIVDTAWDEDALLSSLDEIAAVVYQHALPEARDAAAKEAERVRKFILKRKGEILADITPEPPDWPEPGAGAGAGFELESFKLRFETTWGTSQSANPLAEGTVYELNEDGEWVAAATGEAGATAGPASPQEAADIGVEDAALFTVMGLYPDGTIQGVTFWLPVDRIIAGTTLTIGVDAGVGGAVWHIPPGGSEPEGFIPVTAGAIELTEGSTAMGAAIAGILYADFDGPSSRDESADSGTLETSFETAWGSNKNPNPIGQGEISQLKLNGSEQSLDLAGVVAGLAGPNEMALMPGVDNLASITAMVVQPDGSVGGMTLVMPADKLAVGATLVIGTDAIVGGVWTLPAGAAVPDSFTPFTEGMLELSAAGTDDGAAISASFSGVFGGAVDAQPIDPDGVVDPGPVGSVTTEDGLVINEIAAKGDPLDWFELYNASEAAITLSDYVVADDLDDDAERMAFPSGMEIAPGGYLQVEVDSDNWAGFKLGGDEELGIWTADGDVVALVDWNEGHSGEGESLARIPDATGDYQTVGNPTPGAANQP